MCHNVFVENFVPCCVNVLAGLMIRENGVVGVGEPVGAGDEASCQHR